MCVCVCVFKENTGNINNVFINCNITEECSTVEYHIIVFFPKVVGWLVVLGLTAL